MWGGKGFLTIWITLIGQVDSKRSSLFLNYLKQINIKYETWHFHSLHKYCSFKKKKPHKSGFQSVWLQILSPPVIRCSSQWSGLSRHTAVSCPNLMAPSGSSNFLLEEWPTPRLWGMGRHWFTFFPSRDGSLCSHRNVARRVVTVSRAWERCLREMPWGVPQGTENCLH